MDSAGLILTEAVSQPIALEKVEKTDAPSEAAKMQAARDFESVFIAKLLDEMKNTIGEWGLAKDAASRQLEGIFWLYLARDVADNGGLGMAKDIYRFLTDSENNSPPTELLDESL
jgi:Rod binding domain-containing protein